ncbi:MAG: hypothetical protein K2H16_01605 [Prevotella sp.]|nr:hypothetical protein [Prevotella sp.]
MIFKITEFFSTIDDFCKKFDGESKKLLKNKAEVVHSRHRDLHNFIMNICGALTAYTFFDNKPEALPVHVEKSAQLTLF